MAEEPEENGERDAENKAGDDRKVKGGVLAAMDDIAGKSSKAEGEPAAKIKKCSEENKEPAKKQKSTT